MMNKAVKAIGFGIAALAADLTVAWLAVSLAVWGVRGAVDAPPLIWAAHAVAFVTGVGMAAACAGMVFAIGAVVVEEIV